MLDAGLHPNTQTLLEAWRRMDSAASPPGRHGRLSAEAQFEPDGHAALVASLFVLRRTPEGAWIFRSAGDSMTARLSRVLLDHDFLDFWSGEDRAFAKALLEAVSRLGHPGVLKARGSALNGFRLDVEIALAPLPRETGASRLLGLYQVLGPEGPMHGRPVSQHAITAILPPHRPPARPRLRLVASNDTPLG